MPLDILLSLGQSRPVTAYLYDEPEPGFEDPTFLDTFVFQYWPASLQIAYEPEYATKQVPGGSHPLYQWVGGNGRTISFEAVFTNERNDPVFGSTGFDILSPSARYTVNVAAALARLQSYQMPTYVAPVTAGLNGNVRAPKRLVLALPNSAIGGYLGGDSAGNGRFGKGFDSIDAILVILRTAAISIESWFPDGTPRVATVQLSFNEVVQRSVQGQGSAIQFMSADRFRTTNYRYKGFFQAETLGAP